MKNVLIIGGKGGIGHAIFKLLSQDDSVDKLFVTYRVSQPDDPLDHIDRSSHHVYWIPMDVSDEDSIITAIAGISALADHIDWVINCVGLLHTSDHQPEKAVRQLDPKFFLQNMSINALPSLLIAKHISPLLQAAAKNDNSRPQIFATISARVGSISDNRLGGWYSYRMSKAALNMGMKTLSIEWQRTLDNVCVVVLQPGTVDTKLSEPFQHNVPEDKLLATSECAKHLLKVLTQMQVEDTGSFIDWAGEQISW